MLHKVTTEEVLKRIMKMCTLREASKFPNNYIGTDSLALACHIPIEDMMVLLKQLEDRGKILLVERTPNMAVNRAGKTKVTFVQLLDTDG